MPLRGNAASGLARRASWRLICPRVRFTGLVSGEEFDCFVKLMLAMMRLAPHNVLGVADEVSPDGLERRVRCVCEQVEQYGVYE